MKLLIIEDDITLRNELSTFLSRYNYTVDAPDTALDIIAFTQKSKPDLILLDINLPVYDGYYICRELRKIMDTPIIIVTSRDTEFDELMSMNLGADDFITKPYNTQILLARIASVLRRSNPSPNTAILKHRNLSLDLSKGCVRCGQVQIDLTRNEIGILSILITHKDEIVSREAIMTALWQSDTFVDDNTLTVNINRLRKKLADIGVTDYLITKRGQGYMVVS